MTDEEPRRVKPANASMKNNGIGDCYANLAAAIIEQACSDYVNAPSGSFKRIGREVERFFRSEWFHTLSNGAVDGERAIAAIRKRRRNRIMRELKQRQIERERKKEREGVADEER